MAITVAAVLVNYILCRGLILGEFGLPQLGVAGAGWAKLIVAVFQLGAVVAYAYLTPGLRGYGLFIGRKRVDPATCAEILRLGLPVAGIVILEMSLFMFVSIGSGIIGPVAAATHQVLLVWISLAFKTAHGLAEAGMIRVARAIGEGSPGKCASFGARYDGNGCRLAHAAGICAAQFPRARSCTSSSSRPIQASHRSWS